MDTQLNKIADDVAKVLTYSQYYAPEACEAVPQLIEKWYEAKKHLRETIFKDRLILNDLGEISVNLSTSAKIEKAEILIRRRRT